MAGAGDNILRTALDEHGVVYDRISDDLVGELAAAKRRGASSAEMMAVAGDIMGRHRGALAALLEDSMLAGFLSGAGSLAKAPVRRGSRAR